MKRILAFFLALLLPLSSAALAAEEEPAVTPTKQETVYVDTDALGNPTQILASVYLSNEEEAKAISDVSELTDIVGLGGESFSQEGDALTWDVGGESLYYQGASDKQLPVTMRIAYTLDGESIAPEELPGKSGHLKMGFTFENNVFRDYPIMEESARIYTPFVVMTMVSLDTSLCENIQVTDARTMQQDGAVTVIGVCVPGLMDSLNMGADIMDIPDSFSIEADVRDFRLDSITSMIAANLFSEDDLKEPDKIQSVLDDLDELSDGAQELVDGTAELSDGVSEMGEGIDDIVDAHKELRDGAKKLANGLDDLTDGAGSLRSGAKSLKEGLDTLEDSLTSLAEGLTEMRSSTKELAKAAKSMAEGISSAEGGSSAPDLSDVKSLVKSNNSLLESLSEDESPAVAALSATNSALNSLIKAIENSSGGADISQLASAAQSIADGLDSLSSAQKTTISGVEDMAKGAGSSASGASSLADGASSLKDGASSASSGASSLRKGLDSLVDGGGELKDGYNDLKEGVDELADGMKEFAEEGIDTLVTDVNDTVEEMRQRRVALIELSGEYVTYSGLPEGREGNVMFMLQSAAIEKERSYNAEAIQEEIAAAEAEQAEEEPGLWNRIVNWFSGLFG